MDTKPKMLTNLKKEIIKHLIIFAFAAICVIFFSSIKKEELFNVKYLLLFGLIFLQLEAFIWLGIRMFNFKQGDTPREITWNIVKRFIQFYALCFIIAAILFIVMLLGLYKANGVPLYNFVSNIIEYELRGWLVSTNTGLLFGAFVFFLTQWQDALKREQKLREEKLAFQYETLNQQVNPHFLFNSLNTLASFISTKPNVAEEYVSKLSTIYRYIIDNVSKNHVPLNDEIAFIKDYFYLHKLRDEEKIDLQIDVPENNDFKIIPVSLQILIENALKHNIASKVSPLVVKVSLNNNVIQVENNLQKMTTIETSLKKGLKNLTDRVKLTTGNAVEIEESKSVYKVKIPLQ